MQLMSDAITVLGSRHGVFIDPCRRKCYLIRGTAFPGIACEIRAGMTIDGRTRVLPLCANGELFDFYDQDMTPTSMKLTGVDSETATKLELTIATFFRPRDERFSTMPILDISLSLRPLEGSFRWTSARQIEGGKIFLEISSESFHSYADSDRTIYWGSYSPLKDGFDSGAAYDSAKVSEALVVHEGSIDSAEVSASFGRDASARLHVSWCAFPEPMLRVYEEMVPFKYQQYFESLADVTAWAKANPNAIADNSAKVDRLLIQDSMPRSVANLMALTLHSWAACSWWTDTPHGEWFTVWEGSCYFHSTVDVEYTQAPFYLALWPELLGLELDIWPRFVVGGEEVLGEAGCGTVVFMHDIGRMNCCDTTRYPHHMPVEENTNYVLMSYGYWKRTGDFSRIARHAEIILKALNFVALCDTTGNGVPDRGTANTIDDASPAVQFGKEQVYLAVKAMAALDVGAEMLERAGTGEKCAAFREQADKIRKVVEDRGWQGDHFAVLLDKSAHGVTDAWTGRSYAIDELPGWDAAHIYTSNCLPLLDMVGRKVGLDEVKLRADIKTATKRCLAKYGCLHSDHKPDVNLLSIGEGGTRPSVRPGWISMNMLRDISAFYRGVDLRYLAGRYWDFQTLTNTQGTHLFFETFNGNNLMCYPRGVTILGFYDGLGGVRIDMERKTLEYRPLNDQVEAPVLLLADWERGVAPMIKDGSLHDPEGLLAKTGLQLVKLSEKEG